MNKPVTIILAGVLLLLTVIFTIQNSAKAQIELFFWDADISLSLILFTTLLIGILIGIFALIPTIFRLRKKVNKLKRSL